MSLIKFTASDFDNFTSSIAAELFVTLEGGKKLACGSPAQFVELHSFPGQKVEDIFLASTAISLGRNITVYFENGEKKEFRGSLLGNVPENPFTLACTNSGDFQSIDVFQEPPVSKRNRQDGQSPGFMGKV
jgi:hypothetical protein